MVINSKIISFRELLEESGLTAITLNEIGLINFEFVNDPVILEVHVFETWDFTGKPHETEGMFVTLSLRVDIGIYY